jgi:catechol 2,3-dioxygenase-like lactoylglutathione lyase family enzyme
MISPGGVTLRVNNLSLMKSFYRTVLGFALVGEFPSAALLEITGTHGRPTQPIGLFKRSACVDPGHAAVHRVVVSFPPGEYELRKRQLELLGFQFELKTPQRICLRDPEGNPVELVRHFVLA